jgi:hypothetical protein
MKIQFTHAGIERTLTKHSAVLADLAANRITEAEAARRPWYLRFTSGTQRHTFRLQSLTKAEAISEARDLLNQRTARPNEFAAFIAAKDAAKSVTIGTLAADWLAAGLPFNRTDHRTPDAAARLRATLERCLPWWTDKPAAGITQTTLEDYAAHRAPALRSADVELAALSSLCQWAVFCGRIEKNPFATRRRYQPAKEAKHCHEACPNDDETLHKILGWLFETEPLAAGTLTFCALTGLRPGEPAALQRLPVLAATPANTRDLPPGTIFPDRTGQLRMKVARLKHGQNPFVLLHPAAESFLSAWRAYLAKHQPDATQLFPIGPDQTILNRALNRASTTLVLPHYKPHAMRAYYVKVRRSQGADDSTIAGELGQTTNGELIRTTYGDPQDLHGGAMFDWLPEDAAPAWNFVASFVASKPTQDGNKSPNLAAPQNGQTAANSSTGELQNPLQTLPESENTLQKQGV